MKYVVTAIAAALMSSTAFAADLVIEEPAAIYSPAAYDWTGFYVGINGGYGGGTFEHPFALTADDGGDLIDLATGSIDVTAGGFLYGVQAGYNVQMDNILFGIEGDIQGSTIDGRVSLSITDEQGIFLPDPGDTIDADAGTSLDWLATIRPRIGFVQDRFVVYATGGLAWGQTTSSINLSVDGTPLFDTSITNDRFGWTIGAGIEYALTDNITFKTEYLYTDLGSAEIVNEELGIDPVTTFTMDSDVAFHVVRAGLNFQF
jgi:outer membrane immunogenic protein